MRSTGLFVLSFRRGADIESMKISARIAYVSGALAGLTLTLSDCFLQTGIFKDFLNPISEGLIEKLRLVDEMGADKI